MNTDKLQVQIQKPKEPLRKKFAKSLGMDIVFPALLGVSTFFGSVASYNAIDYDWDMGATDKREYVLNQFTSSMSELQKVKSDYNNMGTKISLAILNGDTDQQSTLLQEKSDQLKSLEDKSNNYMKAMFFSYDIHEKDVENLVGTFNENGFAKYTPLSIDKEDAKARDEVRDNMLSKATSAIEMKEYKQMSKTMSTAKVEASLAVMAVALAHFFVFLFAENTIISMKENWKNLPDKRPKTQKRPGN